MADEDHKVCTKCATAQPLDSFYVVKKTGYRRTWCKGCTAAQAKVWAAANQERRREIARKSMANPEKLALRHGAAREWRHGISPERYVALLEQQNGVCAACKEPETWTFQGKVRALSVDHDHRCCPGKRSCGQCIRGLLCNKCNRTLGLARDDAKLLLTLVAYLEESRG